MITHFRKVVLRTPAFSMRSLHDINYCALNPFFRDGLYLSSLEFCEEYDKHLKGVKTDEKKFQNILYKYWSRSCVNCTPFGLFAGSLVVDTGEKTEIVLEQSDKHRKDVRLDTDYLMQLIQIIVNDPGIKVQSKYYSNNTIYTAGDSYRYSKRISKNGVISYHLESLAKDAVLEAVICAADAGVTLPELKNIVHDLVDALPSEVEAYIYDLLSSQILISELEPPITGELPLDYLINKLAGYQGADDICTLFTSIRYLLSDTSSCEEILREVEALVTSLNTDIKPLKNILQADLYLTPTRALLHQDTIDTIVSQCEEWGKCGFNVQKTDLEAFKTAFLEKYEGEEVPLVIALDAECGVGYGGANYSTSLIDSLDFRSGSDAFRQTAGPLEQLALHKYSEWVKGRNGLIQIEESDLASFADYKKEFRFSNSSCIVGNLLKTPDATGYTFNLTGFNGPCGAKLLGRFAHGNDAMHSFTKEIVNEEEKHSSQAIFVEIVHLPESRIGNIILRPALRTYELPYLGRSGMPQENQIEITDVLVSVKNDEIILRSKKLNKRVIPRLTTAHNYSVKSLPIYKVLCDLQYQGSYIPAMWRWGVLSEFEYLPRVVYKSLIISRATWKIDTGKIGKIPSDPKMYQSFFDEFRNSYNLPARVLYKEGDNELLIDFENHNCLSVLVEYVRMRPLIVFEEFLFTEENCIAQDSISEPYISEMIIPIRTVEMCKEEVVFTDELTTYQRKFLPGSEWLYFKIYLGAVASEKLLTDVILAYIRAHTGSLFEKFFFIRYRDDGQHLRIRFYNSDISRQMFLQKHFSEILAPLIENGTVHKVVLDTYQREIERYGGHLIEETETLFFHDSRAALELIALYNVNDPKRIMLAMRSIDMYLNDFGFSLLEKHHLLWQMRNDFFKEFDSSMPLQKQLNEKYRSYQKDIFVHMNAKNDIPARIYDAVFILKLRSKRNGPVINSIFEKLAGKSRNKELFNLLPSYIHMFMNRYYPAEQRKHELVIYHFLEKYYNSQIAIAKHVELDIVSN